MARFEREARAAGALNHPNIAVVYDTGKSGEIRWIAEEFIDGDPLSRVIARGAVPARKAVDFAIQIADGLAAAHAADIIHRDLKPGNIMVARDGRVKMVDFGLAKRRTKAAGASTLPVDLTDTREILGTAAYMSPEQVRGQEADHRSDIFSLGLVLYELLAGRRAFAGDCSIQVMNAILTEDPPDLPATVPHTLARIVSRCLEKEPAIRFQTAADLSFALAAPLIPVGRPRRAIRAPLWLAWTTAAILFVTALCAVLWGWVHFREKSALPNLQFSIYAPKGVTFTQVRYGGPPLISPNGLLLAFSARNAQGISQVWVQSLDSLLAKPLPGTEAASFTFWSPDSRYLGFFQADHLSRISIDGGAPQTLATAGWNGGTWGASTLRGQQIILFSTKDGLARLPAQGGEIVAVTRRHGKRKELDHVQPQFLPDGRHFLYVVRSELEENSGIYIGDIRSKPEAQSLRRLMPGSSRVWWAPPGHLLFVREDNLVAQAFDAVRLTLTGDPFLVAEHVGHGFNRPTSDFSVSTNGVLAWRGDWISERQLSWLDRRGAFVPGLLLHEPYRFPSLSPQGDRAAVVALAGISARPYDSFKTPRNVSVLNLATGTLVPVAFGEVTAPIWSADGKRIAFCRIENGRYSLYTRSLAGGATEELLLSAETPIMPLSWSHDGRFMLVGHSTSPGFPVFLFPISRDRKLHLFAEDVFKPDFSPDDRWIAYSSFESGRGEVSVVPFGSAGPRWQISRNGGLYPRWRRDGRELFFMSLDFKIMAATIHTAGKFSADPPVPLIDTAEHNPSDFEYAVSPRGDRFLVSRLFEDDKRPINIALNWLEKAKR